MQILNFCCNHHYCYKVRGGSIDKFCPSRKLLICLLSFPTWISIPIPNTRLTRFLPSTITRFWDRITFCIVPVSPTSLPAITITCKKSPSHKAGGPWKMQRRPDCILQRAEINSPHLDIYKNSKKQEMGGLQLAPLIATLSPRRIFHCLNTFWAAFQPIAFLSLFKVPDSSAPCCFYPQKLCDRPWCTMKYCFCLSSVSSLPTIWTIERESSKP